jgi:hypothetical protein
MTVMCDRFFGVPQSAMRLGKIKALSPSALKLYIALWHESERYSIRELARTVKQLAELVGGSRNSHAKARTELTNVGLVIADPYGTDGFLFQLCDPETGKPWPLNPTERPTYQRKDTTVSAEERSPSKARTVSKSENAGTKFPFGWNSADQVPSVAASPATLNPLRWDDIGIPSVSTRKS